MHSWKYIFTFDDGRRAEFAVSLDPKTLDVETVPPENPPDWTRLEYRRCSNCPLDPKTSPRCPIALNIAAVVEGFRDMVSAQSVQVTVVSGERTVSRRTLLAEGVYSLLGIYMAAGGCPVMEKLKPLAATHLPFSTIEETVYRVMTMYISAQYFRAKKGLEPDWELKGLVGMYDAIRLVNKGFANRLRGAAEKDALINSLVDLDVFAMVMLDMPASVDGLAPLFAPFTRAQ